MDVTPLISPIGSCRTNYTRQSIHWLDEGRLGFVESRQWGLLSQCPPFRYFPNFSALSKHTVAIAYHVYIWQVSPQLSCGDTWQIWMWLKEFDKHFRKIENFAYGKINERRFSTPTHDPLLWHSYKISRSKYHIFKIYIYDIANYIYKRSQIWQYPVVHVV